MEAEENTNLTRWAIYLTAPDEDTLTAKEARCRRVATDILGFTTDPVGVYRDVGNCRQGQEAMLKAASKDLFTDLIATASGQIGRDAIEFLYVTETLTATDVVIHYADDTTRQAGRDKDDLYQRSLRYWNCANGTRRGMGRMARQGRMPTGTVSYGYDYDPETKTREINEAEADVVRRVFQLAADGASPVKIAGILNAAGIPTRKGGEWTSARVRQLLRNESYIGITHRKSIISEEQFKRVQELLNRNRKETK